MLGKLGKLIVLAGAVEAARRYAKANPEAVGKIANQAAGLVDQATGGKYHDQIDGVVRKLQGGGES
jgi:hypothetical protein